MAQTYVPVARYRVSDVTNGGTTIQNIYNQRTENRTVVDTKDITALTTRNLTETIQADIGGTVSFVVTLPGKIPVLIPPTIPNNPFTT